MKKIASLLLLLSILTGCQNNEDPQVAENKETEALQVLISTPLPASMKGYELYSWDSNGVWHYTLITGTNRNKTYQEITSTENTVTENWVKITVKSSNDLKQLLSQVPAGGKVLWSSFAVRTPGFALPPDTIIEEVKQFCTTLSITLQVYQ